MSNDEIEDLIFLGQSATVATGEKWEWRFAGHTSTIDMPSWHHLPATGTTDINDRYFAHLGRFIASQHPNALDGIRVRRLQRQASRRAARIKALRAELAALEAE